MPQQTSQNTIASQGGRLSHSPWITGHDPTIQQPHSPIGHHSSTVLQHKGPSSILPHKLRHKPKPDLTHQPGLPGTKNISQTQKSHPVGWLLKFRWCRRRDLNPHTLKRALAPQASVSAVPPLRRGSLFRLPLASDKIVFYRNVY